MADKKNNIYIEDEKEFSGGVEFHKEDPVNTSKSEKVNTPIKPTETVGGVEFSKDKKKEELEKVTENNIPDGAIHTMAEDLGKQANYNQGAALQAVLKQERARSENKKKRDSNVLISIISLVMFVAAIGIFFYTTRPDEKPSTSSTVVKRSLLFAENHTRIDTTNVLPLTLASNITNKISSGEAMPGEVTNVYFTKIFPVGGSQVLSTREFLSSIQSSIPGSLLPLLGKNFMLGVYTGNTRKPFLVLEAPSRNTLTHVREWEKTMLQDLARIFNMNITNPELYGRGFSDHQVKNKNLRVLFDDRDDFVLAYSYIDDELLLVVTEQSTFEELLQRLATQF
jgi:hypothetical protein